HPGQLCRLLDGICTQYEKHHCETECCPCTDTSHDQKWNDHPVFRHQEDADQSDRPHQTARHPKYLLPCKFICDDRCDECCRQYTELIYGHQPAGCRLGEAFFNEHSREPRKQCIWNQRLQTHINSHRPCKLRVP